MQEKAHSWEVEVIRCTEKLSTAARERSEMKRNEAEARSKAAAVHDEAAACRAAKDELEVNTRHAAHSIQ